MEAHNHNHNVYIGGRGGNWPYVHLDDILEWDETQGEWKEMGKMSQQRSSHGMAVVNVDDVIEYCTKN